MEFTENLHNQTLLYIPRPTIHLTKLAACIFYINRLLSAPITDQARQQEWNTIYTIAKNNGFPLQLTHNLKNKITRTQHTTNNLAQKTKKKWIKCTYHSPLIHKVTNLFKNTNLHIALRTNNTILKYLCHQSSNNKLIVSGIHRLQAKHAKNPMLVKLAEL